MIRKGNSCYGLKTYPNVSSNEAREQNNSRAGLDALEQVTFQVKSKWPGGGSGKAVGPWDEGSGVTTGLAHGSRGCRKGG